MNVVLKNKNKIQIAIIVTRTENKDQSISAEHEIKLYLTAFDWRK